MFKAIKDEIKNGITKTLFHIIRFGGLLIVPFIYGFSYIYAFYDPFHNVDQVKISIITYKDPLGERIGEELSNGTKTIKMGDIDLTLKIQHIYYEDTNIEQEKKDSYAYLEMGKTTLLEKGLINLLSKNNTTLIIDIFKFLADKKNNLASLTLNNKKNYLLSFGIDAGSSMYSTTSFLTESILESFNNNKYIKYLAGKIKNSESLEKNKDLIEKTIKRIKNSNPFNKNHSPIKIKGHMSEHTKYGFGLAPFFISVAMWIGSMSLTFAIHRKIYDKKIEPGKRYFAKWLLIVSGVILQATILMVPLYFIGFNELGLNHWALMYGGAMISGIIFTSIIQAIRFAVTGRNVGIFIVVILLVLQMASGGGLFPIETQSHVYQVLNKILPIGRTISIIRELTFSTNWANIMIDLGYLLIWLFIVPISVVITHYRTVKYYLNNNWELPPKLKSKHLFNIKEGYK